MRCARILIVEDDKDIRETMEFLLQAEGYDVDCAINGREALDLLKARKDIYLILLDLMMPVMSGWEFLDHRNGDERLKECPVVIVSAAGEAAKNPLPHVDEFIKKPVELDTLLAFVRRYCGDGRS